MNIRDATTNIVSSNAVQTAPAFGVAKPPEVSVVRIIISVIAVVLTLFAVALLADWALLAEALREFGAQLTLLVVLAVVYSGAFFMRALAWKALMVSRANVFQLFVALQAGLLVNHIAPLKLGEFARTFLATRSGVPLAESATTTAVARVLDFVALLAIASSVGALGNL